MSNSDVNRLPDAVQWAEGMLLTPQHFQQHDIYWNAVLQQRLRGISEHCWGVRHIVMDTALLASGIFVVEELACVFPDGVPYVLQSGDPTSLRISIKPQDLMDGRSVKVCIAMPPRTGAMKVPSTSIRRYERVPGEHPVIDEMTGIADVYVDRIRPKVELFLEQDVPAGYCAVPLIEVSRNPQNAQVEPTAYHPPMLRMGASAFLAKSTGLQRALKRLRDQMWDKLHKLTGMAQIDAQDRIAVMSGDERSQLSLARHIASAAPMLDAVLLDPEVSPAEAYRALAQVVACMTRVGSNPAPLVMLPYAHLNCAPQFLAAIDFVSRKLGLINTEWDSMPFARVGEQIYARRLPEDISSPLYLELRLREGQDRDDVIAWLAESNSRIGSEALMPVLRQARHPGASRRILDATELGKLGLRSDAVIIRIDNVRIDDLKQGTVDCFQPGRSILIQSESSQHMPAAVMLLQHRLDSAQAAGVESSAESGVAHA